MSAERLDRGVVPRQFGFGQRGVDFIVAYLMDKDRRAAPAALQLWDQVMPRLFRLRRNVAKAKRANRRSQFNLASNTGPLAPLRSHRR